MSGDPLVGSVLSERYRVDELIGEGAMGRVYRAEHVLMRKRVALKVLHKELSEVPEVVARFEREARAAAHIQHVHVAGATDFGRLPDGSVYLVLEFVEGTPLSELISHGPTPLRRALAIGLQVSSALVAAHQSKIVHRDLKPDNILLIDGEDEEDFVKVLDFGVAKVPAEHHDAEDRPITQMGMVYGTPEYMAPEQAVGQEVDARADLYALGVILYELLTGRRPFLGPAQGLVGQQLSQPLPKMGQVANVQVPPSVEQFVAELLAPQAKHRTKDAISARDQLEALLQAVDEGRIAGSAARSSALFSATFEDVTSRMSTIGEPITRVAKSRESRLAMTSLVFGSIGVVGAIVAVGLLIRSRAADEKMPAELPPAVVVELPDHQQDVEKLIAEAADGGIDAMEKLASEHPTEGLIQAELAKLYADAKRFTESVDAVHQALALDPKLNEDKKVHEALFAAGTSQQGRLAAFRLLKGAMGPVGIDIIYEMAQDDTLRDYSRGYAQLQLRKTEVRSAASPSLQLVFSFQDAAGRKRADNCEEFAHLLERARSVGDKRVLPELENLREVDGCGPRLKDDCYPCLRGGDSLESVITSIEGRATLGAREPDKSTEPQKEH